MYSASVYRPVMLALIAARYDRTNCTNSSSSVKYLIRPLSTCSTDPRHVAGAPSTSRCSNHTRTMNAEALSSSSTSWLSHPGEYGSGVAAGDPSCADGDILAGGRHRCVTITSQGHHRRGGIGDSDDLPGQVPPIDGETATGLWLLPAAPIALACQRTPAAPGPRSSSCSRFG